MEGSPSNTMHNNLTEAAGFTRKWLTMKNRRNLLLLILQLTLLSVQSQDDGYSSSKVIELDVENFEEALQARDWTCILMYDPWDEQSTYEHTLVLEGVYDRFVSRQHNEVTF